MLTFETFSYKFIYTTIPESMLCIFLHRLECIRFSQKPFLICVFYCFILFSIISCTHKILSVNGTVSDPNGKAVADAIVRVRTNSLYVLSDSAGNFILDKIEPSYATTITAWKEGYYISGAGVGRKPEHLDIILRKHQSGDKDPALHITKAGNKFLRTAFVGAAKSYRDNRLLYSQKQLEQMSPQEKEFISKMQSRLTHKYRQLRARGKHANKARVAVAREMCGFLWEYATKVIPAMEEYSYQKAA